MGRIIAFKAPAYYSSSRATSPMDDNDSDVDPTSTPLRPSDSPLYSKVIRPELKNCKSVSFSEEPPLICEIPHWDRTPMIPKTQDVVNSTDSESDDDIQTPRHSGATSLQQATRWARRLSM